MSLYTSRGCPALCTFCLWPQTLSGHPWRMRSTDDVADEVRSAKKLFPDVKEIFFDDDTFNIQKARTIELCEKLKPLNFTWSCTSRVTTDYDTLKAMKDAGCRLLIVGYESGDPQILKNIKKGATVERPRSSPRDCKKLGLVDPRRLHHRTARRDARNHSQHHRLRQAARLRNHSGLDRSRLSRHRVLRLRRSRTVSCRPTPRWWTKAGTRWRTSSIRVCPPKYIMEMVHRFYDEYYFRPKAAFRIVRKAAFDSGDRKRLYKEAKAFLKTRAMRNKWVREKQESPATAAPAKA